jgi:iron complex transport system substrate-binding protein
MAKTITISAIILFSLAAILVQDAQAYPINVTDDFGYNVTITNATRIVSLAPSNTEILFAVGAGSRVVGVTDYCDYPPEVENISRIGGYASVNKEAVVNLTPDLVLAAYGNGEQTINQLRSLNLTVVALNPKNTEDIIKNILLVGNITENDANASMIAENMRQEIKDITDATNDLSENQKAKVLYIVWDNPLYAAGSGTYAHDLIGKAGGINIVESSGWPVMSLETVVDKNPQIIITSGMGGESSRMRDRIMNNTVLAQTNAVRDGRVYAVADPNIIERSGPRITQGLKELYEYIAPVKSATTQTSIAGSGSGVITSEPYENIVKAERHERNLIYNSPVTYTFSAPEHGIYEIIVTGKANEIDVAMRIEALKGASKSVAIPPPRTVYKNLNILVGTEKIKEAVIRFKVENSWISGSNLATSDVKMVKWDGSKWVQLETTENTKDSAFTYYEVNIETFSSFAITGSKAAASPTAVQAEVPATPTVIIPAEPTVSSAPTSTPKSPGFEYTLAVVALLVVFLKRRL